MDDSQQTNIGHSEFELIVVLILIGFLGLAGFIWFIETGGRFEEKRVATFSSVDTTTSEADFLNPDDVPGRDPNVLGLRVDRILGSFFVHPENGQTLYFTKAGSCEGTCLESWTPLLASRALPASGSLSTVKRADDGELQYAWNGNALYTYNEDSGDSVLGDGAAGVWRVARP